MSYVFGKGRGFYLGTELEPAGLDWLLDLVCAEAGVMPVARNISAGVEVLHRSKGGKSWLFMLNHTGEKIYIPLQGTGRNLLTGEIVNSAITMEATGIAVIETI